MSPKLELVITSRERDLGSFSVRRILPYASHRMVGPFIFFDHMGPANFKAGERMDVRPHPHINLATVTYLFEGKIMHRDSLGSRQSIEPGAINWMTAGKGIVHSERSLEEDVNRERKLHGIQLWVALPEKFEECAPSFNHHPKNTLPEFFVGEVAVKLLLGEAFDRRSPVPVLPKMFYAEADFKAGQELVLKSEGQETAVYLVNGQISVEGEALESCSMAVGKAGEDIKIVALRDSKVMLLGGEPLGSRFIFWNFVSSSKERLEEAKRDWANGPVGNPTRFFPIEGDNLEFIPLPSV